MDIEKMRKTLREYEKIIAEIKVSNHILNDIERGRGNTVDSMQLINALKKYNVILILNENLTDLEQRQREIENFQLIENKES